MGKRLIGSVGLSDSGVPDDLLTTKGDTHGFSSTNARIPIGANDTVLTADSSEALGLKWASAGGGATVTIQEASTSSTQTGIDTTLTDVDDMTLTMPTRANGKAIITCNMTFRGSTNGINVLFNFDDDGVKQTVMGANQLVLNTDQSITITHVTTLDGQVVKVQAKVNSGTLNIYGGTEFFSTINSLEVS